ncbi:S8 family peptidase [Mycobacteroides abscessus subsp. abscessus]|uniref:S8 family peptidase n=1 Tax=Mycobacteroides abscessus TaxID=36809 RepID=UPI0039EE4EA1
MTVPGGEGNLSRRLLHGGEALRIEVEPTRGGGGVKFDPQTAEEACERLLPQVHEVARRAHSLPDQLRAPDRLYLEAKLLPNYIAASYFPTELLNRIGAVPVGSRADSGVYRTRTKATEEGTRRIIFAINEEGVDDLVSLFESGDVSRVKPKAFQDIRMFDEIAWPTEAAVLLAPPPEPGSTEDLTWEAVLHPETISATGAVAPASEATLERWFELIEAEHGEVYRDFIAEVGGLTFVPLRASRDAAGHLSQFNPLRALRPMPVIRSRPAQLGLRQLLQTTAPPTSTPVANSVRVAVFDGGVDTTNSTTPSLFPIPIHDLTSAPPNPDDTAHGTGVTGAVLYGMLIPGQTAPQPPLPVESFRILPAPPDVLPALAVYWALDQIIDKVASGSFQIVNLSLGIDVAVEQDKEPNRWTSELDKIAWETDVLFIVAAGNNGHADHATGLNRVQVPADMANGLSIGACDTPAPGKPWARAPYSAIGPGRQGNVVQPVGIQFGGHLPDAPFEVLRADGTHWQGVGTSFAAPVMTHALADLTSRLPRVNSSVLRTFTAHFAERHHHAKKYQNELGHGRLPLHFVDILDCGPDEVHVLFIDTITRGELLGYQLPAPDTTYQKLALQMTMAYASSVDPTQPTEYTNASLDLTLRPHAFMYRFTPPKELKDTAKARVLNLRTQEALDLMAADWTPGQEPVNRPLDGFKGDSEHRLRDSGKWETIRHHRLTLSAGQILDPRLEVGYLARRAGALDNAPTEVPFALLVTLRDKEGNGTLYDQVRQRFRALQPVQRLQAQPRIGVPAPRWE